jgi:hypothetical protein
LNHPLAVLDRFTDKGFIFCEWNAGELVFWGCEQIAVQYWIDTNACDTEVFKM